LFSTEFRKIVERTRPPATSAITLQRAAPAISRNARLSRRIFRRRQPVAEAAHGLDYIFSELAAQTPHENLDRVGIPVEILIVKMFDQFGARNHAALMMHHIGEQAIFERG